MRTHVFGQGAVDRGGVGAETAFKRLFPGMLAQVPRQRPLFAAGVRTELAFERLFTRVNSHVLRQIPLRRRRVRAKRALERLLRVKGNTFSILHVVVVVVVVGKI